MLYVLFGAASMSSRLNFSSNFVVGVVTTRIRVTASNVWVSFSAPRAVQSPGASWHAVSQWGHSAFEGFSAILFFK